MSREVSAPVWHMVNCQLHGLPFTAEHSPRITNICGQQLCLAAVPERNGHHSRGAALGAAMPALPQAYMQLTIPLWPCTSGQSDTVLECPQQQLRNSLSLT